MAKTSRQNVIKIVRTANAKVAVGSVCCGVQRVAGAPVASFKGAKPTFAVQKYLLFFRKKIHTKRIGLFKKSHAVCRGQIASPFSGFTEPHARRNVKRAGVVTTNQVFFAEE